MIHCYERKFFKDNPTGSIPIYFFVPEQTSVVFPEEIRAYWPWVIDSNLVFDGRFSWTLQTFLQLQSTDVKISLVDEMPDEGIVIAHRDFLPDSLQPNSKVLLVAIKPDRLPHPFAQVHLIQSPYDPLLKKCKDFWPSYFVPSWPQPNLLPRNLSRGNKFENVCFVGRLEHLAFELQKSSWLDELELNWQIRSMSQWHDYNDMDLVVAIRYFGLQQPSGSAATEDVAMKSFTKLTNSWLAGVPAILGREPSYLFLKENDLDYIEATSLKELLDAILQLQKDSALRNAMISHGRIRARKFSIEALKTHWLSLLQISLPLMYDQWRDPSYRHQFILRRETALLSGGST